MLKTQVWGSLFVAVFGFVFALPDYFYQSWYAPVDLTVIDVEQRRSGSDKPTYRPTFEATAPDGSRVRYQSNISTSDRSHHVGEVVGGYANWAKGTMRSQHQIDFSFKFGGLMFTLGFASFVLSYLILNSRRIWRYLRGPEVR